MLLSWEWIGQIPQLALVPLWFPDQKNKSKKKNSSVRRIIHDYDPNSPQKNEKRKKEAKAL
jgi:hypothetical protein